VLGSPAVTALLTEGLKDVVGGWFIVETDPVVAAQKLVDAILERRVGLGLPVPVGATVAG
jgi:carbon-monoxide dehydrogenase catalytic subunit